MFQSIISTIFNTKKSPSEVLNNIGSPQPSSSTIATMPAIKSGRPEVVSTNYTSDPVDIPASFISCPPPKNQRITYERIDFKNTPLPEYEGCYAVVLDNVLSPHECNALISFAEQSATSSGGWKPAMVNMGYNKETLVTDYRNSDRIIWDSPTLVERIFRRCLEVPDIKNELLTIENNVLVQGEKAVERGDKWTFTRPNERMRFLKYTKGQFFDRHCDGSFVNPKSEKMERSLFTLHLYLSGEEGEEENGGATRFHGSRRMYVSNIGKKVEEDERYLDVLPKMGRVLIFQHKDLLHSGALVNDGTKFTMRTDLMYELEVKGETVKKK